MIRVPKNKIVGKLEPKAHGPFKIVGTTPKGNYWLENRDGQRLKTYYPLNRLQIVPDEVDGDMHVEVEEILKHRKVNGRYEYLVKWKNFPSSHNEWLSEDRFDSTYPIEQYHQKINLPVDVNLLTLITNQPFYLMIIIFIGFLLNTVSSIRINGNFRLCQIDDGLPELDLNINCTKNTHISNIERVKMTVLERNNFVLDGYATVCMITEIKTITYKSLFGYQYIKSQNEYRKRIDKEECRSTTVAKKFRDFNLDCTDELCVYSNRNQLSYKWLTDENNFNYEIKIFKKYIFVDSLNKSILADAESSCYAKDYFCYRGGLVYVWDESLLNECPFSKIKVLNMTIKNNIAIAKSDNFLFEIINHKEECGLTLYETSEGLYLTKTNEAHDAFKKMNNSIRSINHLQLSDFDFKLFQFDKAVAQINKRDSLMFCNVYKSLMHMFQKFYNKYISIHDTLNKEIILYNDLGKILICNCIEIKTVYMVPISTQCYEDQPVFFEMNNKNFTGFFHDNNIISRVSTQIDCDFKKYLIMPELKLKLVRVNKETRLESIKNKQINLNFLSKKVINFEHSNLLNHNFELFPEIEKLIKSEEMGHNFFLTNSEEASVIASSVARQNETGGMNILLWMGISVVFVFLLLIVIKLTKTFWRKLPKRVKKNTRVVKVDLKNENIEIEPILNELNDVPSKIIDPELDESNLDSSHRLEQIINNLN